MTKKQIKTLFLNLFGLELAYSGKMREFHDATAPKQFNKQWLLRLVSKRYWTIYSLSQFFYQYYRVKAQLQYWRRKPIPHIESNLSELEQNVKDWVTQVYVKNPNQISEYATKQTKDLVDLYQRQEELLKDTPKDEEGFTTKEEFLYKVNKANEIEESLLSFHKRDWEEMNSAHLADRIELRKARQALSDEKRRIKNAYKTACDIERRGTNGGRRRRRIK